MDKATDNRFKLLLNRGFGREPLREQLAKAFCLLNIERNIRRDPGNSLRADDNTGIIYRAMENSYPDLFPEADAAITALEKSEYWEIIEHIIARVLGQEEAKKQHEQHGPAGVLRVTLHCIAVLKMIVGALRGSSDDLSSTEFCCVRRNPTDNMVLVFARWRDGDHITLDKLSAQDVQDILNLLEKVNTASDFFEPATMA